VHQAPVEVPERAQPPGPNQQALLHPGRQDGQGVRQGEDACFLDVQAHRPPPFPDVRDNQL